MLRLREFVLLPALLFLLSGCGESAAQQKKAAQAVMEIGKIENGVYSNAFFGLSVPVPQGWHVTPNETMNQMTQDGARLISGDNKRLQAALEAAPTVNLLAVFEHPVGAPVDFNPSFISIAEKISALPGLKTGKDYLFHAKKHIAKIPSLKMKPDLRTGACGGREFDILDTYGDVGPLSIKQAYYATVMKGYAVCFIVSYSTPAQKAAVEKVLQSVKFDTLEE